MDLLPAVGNRQHDAARLPADDLLAPVGERDTDENPIWAWGLGDTLVEDHAKLPGCDGLAEPVGSTYHKDPKPVVPASFDPRLIPSALTVPAPSVAPSAGQSMT